MFVLLLLALFNIGVTVESQLFHMKLNVDALDAWLFVKTMKIEKFKKLV